jgi:hypothetical protein
MDGVSQIQPFGDAMKRHQKLKKQNMKTRILLTTIGAAALAAITLNVNAGTTLLSPRAQGDQSKVASDIAAAQPANTVQTTSPRALGNQTKTGAGVANDVNPATQCSRHMTASPKAIQACAANPSNMPCCAK